MNETTTIKLMEKRTSSFCSKKDVKAVKIIQINPNQKDFINRIQKYYTLMKKVQNSHIVKVNEFFFINQTNYIECWIVMDYCNYHSLDQYIKSNPLKNDIIEKKCFISDISIGLEYIYYTIGYHHYHLCPENILLEKDLSSVYTKVRINNFGLMDKINGIEGIGITEYNPFFQPPEFVKN